MRRDERALSAVPAWVWASLAVALGLQLLWHTGFPRALRGAHDLPPAPSVATLRLASFGESAALARLTMLYVQSYDLGGTNSLPYRDLDYGRLIGWLESCLELDPRSDYPLFAAARIYAEVPDEQRSRIALDFVYRAFLRAPQRRWAALAHGALVAKHRLHDLPLALRYASAVEQLATSADVPLWARQMRVFILEDMNELEAAKIMLGGMLESGQIADPGERRFLAEHLKELEERIAEGRRFP